MGTAGEAPRSTGREPVPWLCFDNYQNSDNNILQNNFIDSFVILKMVNLVIYLARRSRHWGWPARSSKGSPRSWKPRTRRVCRENQLEIFWMIVVREKKLAYLSVLVLIFVVIGNEIPVPKERRNDALKPWEIFLQLNRASRVMYNLHTHCVFLSNLTVIVGAGFVLWVIVQKVVFLVGGGLNVLTIGAISSSQRWRAPKQRIPVNLRELKTTMQVSQSLCSMLWNSAAETIQNLEIHLCRHQ